jgi:alkanesulfonate monooxygenase SsuD/methylene tetrahydromethanopterin reductase-like flavin-dependent oxidoreductase (luciferase family)
MITDAHRSRPLRFGLHTALPRGTEFGAFAMSVQEAGFDVLTIPDHLVASVSPFAGAMAAAAVTERLHTGTLVLTTTYAIPSTPPARPRPSRLSPVDASSWVSGPGT